MPIIGIDLGTTNSLCSCFVDNKSVLIPNALGSNLTPSVVSILDSGEVIVGAAAKERLITHPQLTAAAFKRYMGTSKKYQLGKRVFTPIELSALVLKSLKADAECFLGTQVTEAVISVPAYFNDQQRRATKEAGELAGLKVDRLINEPTAAAVAYGLHQDEVEHKFLVFDLGGGTFDVSVLDLFDNLLEVRAVAGDNLLGGEDFDQCLVDHFIKKNNLERDKMSIKMLSALKKQAECCKIALTSASKAEMTYTVGEQTYATIVTQEELEKLGHELLLKLKQPLQRALRDSSINPSDLDDVILVGGSTKMPLVRSFVARMFGRLPLYHLNPDEVVGLGAGICAAMKERNETLKETVLTDVCPYTLGVEIAVHNPFGELESGRFLPIIERNCTIPYSKVERLQTTVDNQTHIEINIFQGESRLTANNVLLGSINLFVPPAPRGESAIDVRYTYDINGILEVEVTALNTGEKKREVITNSNTTMTREEIERRLKELSKLKIHPREQSKNQFLLAKGERLYEETLSDLRGQIANELELFEAILDRQNPAEIRSAVERFEKFLNSIEELEL